MFGVRRNVGQLTLKRTLWIKKPIFIKCSIKTAVVQVPSRSLDGFINKLCGRPPQFSTPLQVDLWPFDLESGVRVTCDVGYLCVNFGLSRPLCSRLRPDVRDRQTDVRQTSDAHHRL